MQSRRLLALLSLAAVASCTTTSPPAVSKTPAVSTPPAASSPAAVSAGATEEDPWLWLEEIDGEAALAWVREQNARTARELASTPQFQELYGQALSILNAESRVPRLTWRGNYLYNLWRSSEHPRGIYRRTTLDRLRSGEPRWETVIDIDALSKSEGKPWVFSSMNCLSPENRRCLVSLSPGGGDAVELREFDMRTLRFVENGFFIPVAKTTAGWIDHNAIFVASDFGEGSLTDSGYARIVKRWVRGTPLSSAALLHEGRSDSVSVSARRFRSEGREIDLVTESLTTWSWARYQLIDGRLHRLELPDSAVVVDAFKGKLVLRLTEPWSVAGRELKPGSVLLADPERLRGGAGGIDLLMEPTASATIESVSVTDDSILVTSLDNVRGRLYRFTPRPAGSWSRELIALPDNGAVSVMTTRDESGDALVLFESFITPPELLHVASGARQPSAVLSQQASFDGGRFEVVQYWATSADGTRIPYFVVAPKSLRHDGRNPLHIFSYGGFRVSLTPAYSGSYEALYGAYGRMWLERGGVFVLANIRGGGEFGPEWHSSVLLENRHKVFEDFEAIAADVVARGLTRPELIGIEGRSNGGLLTLGTMVRRPELYGAVISGVPLSDMKRYHRLLAGASWMAEYGNPDLADQWSYLGAYSPYQNFRAGARYPPVFVYTSTRDDRVHPGHARKTVARLLEQGHEVWYYENIEGGHGGSSTNEQLAYRISLSYTHLWRHLDPGN